MTKASCPPEVEADIKTRSNAFGLGMGLMCIPTAFVGGSIGSCCPCGSFIGVIPVLSWAFWGGFLAAMFLDWSRIRQEDALGVGARVGLRTGLIAGALGASATVLVATLFAGVIGSNIAAMSAVSGAADPSAEGAAFMGLSVLANVVVTAISIIPAVVLGTIGGVFGAAIKRK